MRDANDVYYRVGQEPGEESVIVAVQYFDEKDYDEDFWITPNKFDTRDDAQEWLDERNANKLDLKTKDLLVRLYVHLENLEDRSCHDGHGYDSWQSDELQRLLKEIKEMVGDNG